jgi:hypothetical protein
MESRGQFIQPTDLYFVHWGGKGELATLAGAYTALKTTTAVIADLDLLRNQTELSKVLAALEMDFDRYRAQCNVVVNALAQQPPITSVNDFLSRARALLESVQQVGQLDTSSKSRFHQLIENSAKWSSRFTVEVRAPNFKASCDLEGKANIPGVGHYHVFVDEGSMPMGGGHDMSMPMGQQHDGGMEMMSMPGMISMPCTNSIAVDLSAWQSGRHTINVELEKNDHTPMVEPGGQPKFAQISITLQNPFRP